MKGLITEKNYAYIKMHHKFTRTAEQENGLPRFNMMFLPKGTVIGEKDLSGGYISTFVMYQDKINKNLMVAQYDRDRLEDNAIPVNIKTENGWEKVRVDVDVLAEKVDEVNKEYLKTKKEREEKEKQEQELEEEFEM